ncbi:hypothetical protein P8935_14400 [Telmatobacter sp. DSM 110680]|uniref:Uncharacterized protein n=1 Tax=Telmatobacter sp. DSM 110680 TaxID=3036704 RepID=A0AAU7DEK4_9BACT
MAILVFAVAYGSANGFGQDEVEALGSKLIQELIKQREAWTSEVSTPGASIRVKEVGREESLVRYNLYVSGLPTDRVYTVLTWPIDRRMPYVLLEGVSIGKDGMLMCSGRLQDECDDPSPDNHGVVDFAFRSEKGEPNRLALVASDLRVTVVIVPNPITAKDKACTLSVERLTPRFEAAYLIGSGYDPNTNITVDSSSYEERHAIQTMADSDGNIRFGIMPFVAGHATGTLYIKAIGSRCSPSMKFDWGR